MSEEIKTRQIKDYKNGLIYRIECKDGYYYFGSTCNSLVKRFENHRLQSKHHPERRVYKHLNTIGWENARIVLQERFSCECKMELVQREDHFIRTAKQDPFCLNTICAFSTEEQTRLSHIDSCKTYREQHREVNADYMKSYYQTNKVAILAKSQAKRETAKQQAPCQIE